MLRDLGKRCRLEPIIILSKVDTLFPIGEFRSEEIYENNIINDALKKLGKISHFKFYSGNILPHVNFTGYKEYPDD